MPPSGGITAVSCTLVGNTGGIRNLYQIYIRWNGTNKVQSLQATKLKITTTSILNQQIYFYDRDYWISTGEINGTFNL